MGLISLKYHKKCHNFFDTPSDKCLCNQGIEDMNHFLFLCPLFATRRAINVIANLKIYGLNHLGNQSHLYLYGHRTINFADNRKLLLSTIEYTRDSMLFNVSLLPYPIHPTMSQPCREDRQSETDRLMTTVVNPYYCRTARRGAVQRGKTQT